MYQLAEALLATPQSIIRQLPALVGSLLIAELLYKFHSFTLECAAFLATWFVLDAVIQFFVSVGLAGRDKRP